LRQSGPRNV